MDQLQREFQGEYNMKSALQKQEIDSSMSNYASQIQQNQQMIQAALVEQLNPDKILEDLELKLRGYKRKWDGNLVKSGLPLMNEVGVMAMITYTSSVVNQNTIMASYDKQQISKLMTQFMGVLVDDLTLNWKEYGIVNKSYLDLIANMIMNCAYPAYNRALFGGEKRFLGTTTIENISSVPKMQPVKKEGFLSRFRP